MKRSEAIDILIEQGPMGMDEKIADRMLDALEKVGMLPPSRKLQFKEYEAIRRVCNESQTIDAVYKWDKE